MGDKTNKQVTDEFLVSIAQYLGLKEEDATNEGSILNALVGPEPGKEDIRNEYSGILDSFREQSQGYSSAQQEAMGSQTRQKLAEAARASGGGQRMLSGRSKAMATTLAQSTEATQQAGAVQAVAAKNKKFMTEGQEGLATLEQDIAITTQEQMDAYNKRRADVMLNIEQLKELKRQRNEAE